MTDLDFRNVNTLWGSVLAETLYRLGLRTTIICPGSRSTPLTVALARHHGIDTIPILDERSAAFFALGHGKRTGRPALLVCTSGTAGANMYPAVIEARESRVPLLVMTADRPPELRHCNAGQTIDQQKLFGDAVNGFIELALPSVEPQLLAYLRQTLCHAWSRSQVPVAGAMHLNLPFRDPLPPIPDANIMALESGFQVEPFFAAVGGFNLPRTDVVAWESAGGADVVNAWLSCDRGLIIAGVAQPLDPARYCRSIARLAKTLNWPVLAEGLSPVRNFAAQCPGLVSTYDALLRSPQLARDLKPEMVVRIGEMPTSKILRQWLQETQPLQWVIDGGDRNLDPTHGRTTHVSVTVEQLAAALPLQPPPSAPAVLAYRNQWLQVERQFRGYIDGAMATADPFGGRVANGSVGQGSSNPNGEQPLNHERLDSSVLGSASAASVTAALNFSDCFEGKVAWLLSQQLPPQTPLIIANSTPVRDVEWFWKLGDRQIHPFVNRGANGIDGTLSTALGVAHRHRSSVLLTGDLALLHDTNGFLIGRQFVGHLTIVLINNGGGGIFGLLPIAQFEPLFEKFFATPQAIDFAQLCSAYAVEHERITAWEVLCDRLQTLPSSGIRVLEVCCDRHCDRLRRQRFWASCADGTVEKGL